MKQDKKKKEPKKLSEICVSSITFPPFFRSSEVQEFSSDITTASIYRNYKIYRIYNNYRIYSYYRIYNIYSINMRKK